jgi:hypothetical protein
MDESGMEVNMRNIHEFLKPSFTIQTKYDLMVGSNGAYTPFKYTTVTEIFNREFRENNH